MAKFDDKQIQQTRKSFQPLSFSYLIQKWGGRSGGTELSTDLEKHLGRFMKPDIERFQNRSGNQDERLAANIWPSLTCIHINISVDSSRIILFIIEIARYKFPC